MPTQQIGNIHGFASKGGKDLNGGDDIQVGHFNANGGTLAAKRARLIVINAGYWTAARLDQATHNDIDYALRIADNPATI